MGGSVHGLPTFMDFFPAYSATYTPTSLPFLRPSNHLSLSHVGKKVHSSITETPFNSPLLTSKEVFIYQASEVKIRISESIMEILLTGLGAEVPFS